MQGIITFGEIMLRLSPEGQHRFQQANSFGAVYGGGEFNVSVSLANYGHKTSFVTRLPDNPLGRCALMEMHKRSVGTEHVLFGGERLGIYFLEIGSGNRGSKVVYDRANSSFSHIEPGTIDWAMVFKDAIWFHWSGVTPAVSANAARVCLEALQMADAMGLTISTDLNYRSKLWKYGKEPHEVMPDLLRYTNILLGDLDTTFFMMGKEMPKADYSDRHALPKMYQILFDTFPQLRKVATTLRYSVSASHQKIGGILYDGKTLYGTDLREVVPVVDRVGSGDAFMGGLIHGLLVHGKYPQSALDFAVAACCLKHTIPGDYNLASLEEIQSLMDGDGSGKVMR